MVHAVRNFFLAPGEFTHVFLLLVAQDIGRCHTVILSVHQYMILAFAAGYFFLFYYHCSAAPFRDAAYVQVVQSV